MNICETLNNYVINPKHILVFNVTQDCYSDDIKHNILSIVKEMTIDNLIVIFGSKKYTSECILEYPHYGTKYCIYNKKIECTSSLGTILFPPLNSFISTSNNINQFEFDRPVLVSDKICSYWFPYTKYNTPNVFLMVRFDLDMAVKNIYINICILLYLNSLLTEINHILYMCSNALYKFSIIIDGGRIYMNLHGNYKKFYEVCQFILSKIIDCGMITDQSFETAKYSLIEKYKNEIYDSPYMKIHGYFNKIINKYYYDAEEKLHTITSIKKENVVNVFKTLFAYKRTLLYMTGNCDRNLCTKLNTMFEILNKNNKSYDKFISYRIPRKKLSITIINLNKIEKNIAVGIFVYINTICYNDTKWAKTLCLINLLDNFMATEYYNELRTQESYGYIVSGKVITIGETSRPSIYYMFLIQSPHKTVNEITDRTGVFMNNYLKKLESLSQKDLEIAKKSVISVLNIPFSNLLSHALHIFTNELENEYMKYDFREVIMNNCKQIELKDLIRFYKKKFIEHRIDITIKLDKEMI